MAIMNVSYISDYNYLIEPMLKRINSASGWNNNFLFNPWGNAKAFLQASYEEIYIPSAFQEHWN